jgi:PEGA domain
VSAIPLLRRGGLAAALIALLMIGTGSAWGADAGDPDAQRKAEASAHLRRGAELIDAEDLPGALAQFEAAYRLVPSPTILHNFGIVYQGLGRKAEALDAFQRFLEAAAKAPAAAREHAQRAVQSLRGEVAELRVECEVAGASILIDERRVGETPQERAIYLDAGAYRLSVEKMGVGTVHSERIQVSAGQRLMVSVRPALPPPPATVELRQLPAPAQPRRWQRPAAWTAAVAATAAAGVSVTQLVVRNKRAKEFNDQHCGTADPGQGGQPCRSLLQRGKDAQKWAIASGIAAGVLGVAAGALFLTLPRSGAEVSLDASPSHLGLGLQGRF